MPMTMTLNGWQGMHVVQSSCGTGGNGSNSFHVNAACFTLQARCVMLLQNGTCV